MHANSQIAWPNKPIIIGKIALNFPFQLYAIVWDLVKREVRQVVKIMEKYLPSTLIIYININNCADIYIVFNVPLYFLSKMYLLIYLFAEQQTVNICLLSFHLFAIIHKCSYMSEISSICGFRGRHYCAGHVIERAYNSYVSELLLVYVYS